MFEDQKVELLPERTTMQTFVNQSGNLAAAAAANVLNVNAGRDQANIAAAVALSGSNVFL